VPTVLRQGPFRFFFYAGDRHEPPHVHVEHDTASAKFWLEPVRLQRSNGFKPHELNQIRAIIEERLDLLRESWHDYFEG
jgi:hypothetical protein